MDAHSRAVRYAGATADAERKFVEALPCLIDAIIARAKEGDAKVAAYLIDRVLGKTVTARYAPADDMVPPRTEEDFELERRERESDRAMRRLLA